jgi:hypothetical protein
MGLTGRLLWRRVQHLRERYFVAQRRIEELKAQEAPPKERISEAEAEAMRLRGLLDCAASAEAAKTPVKALQAALLVWEIPKRTVYAYSLAMSSVVVILFAYILFTQQQPAAQVESIGYSDGGQPPATMGTSDSPLHSDTPAVSLPPPSTARSSDSTLRPSGADAAAVPLPPQTTVLPPATTPASPTLTSATCTTLPPACVSDAECGEERNISLWCDGQDIMGSVSVPRCRNPGTFASECMTRDEKRIYGYCGGICFGGSCYPRTCGNKRLDPVEEEVDCGGACPTCEDVRNPPWKRCALDGECGTNTIRKGFRCYNGKLVKEEERHFCNTDKRCGSDVRRIVVEACPDGYGCDSYQGKCVPGEGNCRDCVRNRRETGIDCGGGCGACIQPPTSPNVDLYKELDLASKIYVGSYKGYRIRFLRPIVNVSGPDTCTTGAVVEVTTLNNSVRRLNLDRYSTRRAGGLVVGFLAGDDQSAKVWLTS